MPAKGNCGNFVTQLRGYAVQLVPCEPTVDTRFLCFVALLCCRHVPLANCGWAVVAAEGSLWDPAAVLKKGRPFSVRFPVPTVIHHLHRDAGDYCSRSEQAGMWIFHQKIYLLMTDELQHLAD